MYTTLRSARFVVLTLLSLLTLAFAISANHGPTSASPLTIQLADDAKPNPGG